MLRTFYHSTLLVVLLFAGCGGGNGGSPPPPPSPTLQIQSPAADSTVTGLPLHIRIDFGGLLTHSDIQVTLLPDGGSPTDVTGDLALQAGATLQGWKSSVSAGKYTLQADATDSLGQTVSDSVSFEIAALPDLVIPPGTVTIIPDRPVLSQPVNAGFTVVNEGPVPAPGTIVRPIFDPDDPAVPDVPIPPDITVPPLGPGERFFGTVDIAELLQPGKLILKLDPNNSVAESDESNNDSGGHAMNPGISSWRDLAVTIVNADVLELGRVRFLVDVRNIGTIDIPYPRLRMSVRDRVSGQYVVPAGGSAGACTDGSAAAKVVEPVQALAAGEYVQLEFTEWWPDHTTSTGQQEGARGHYDLCVEGIASGTQFIRWEQILGETDRFGNASSSNNADTFSWDVDPLPAYPASGDLSLHSLTLSRPDAGFASDIRLAFRNPSSADFGYVTIKVDWTAQGGQDGGQYANGTWTTKIVSSRLSRHTLPLPGGAALPKAAQLLFTVTVVPGTTGNGTPLLEEKRAVALNYGDVGVEDVVVAPEPPHLFALQSGADPASVSVRVRNRDDDAVTATVGLDVIGKPNLAPAGELGSLGTQQVDILGGDTATLTFPWSPLTESQNTADAYTLMATVSTTAYQTPFTNGDDQRFLDVPVAAAPNIYPLALEPLAVDFQPNTPVNLRVRLFDLNNTGATFGLKVYSDLEGATPIVDDAAAGPASSTPVWLQYSWTPSRAGYHTVSVHVNNVEEFSQVIFVKPIFTVTGGGGGTIYYEPEAASAYGTDGSLLQWTRTDSVIVDVGDDSWSIGVDYKTFTLDDGTSDPNEYLVTLRVPMKFAGVVQDASLMFATTYYSAAVGAGIRYSGGSCWDFGACPDDLVVQRTLWEEHTSLLGTILGTSRNEVLGTGVQSLVALKWGSEVAASAAKVVVDVALFALDAAFCDHSVEFDDYVEFKNVPLVNGEEYNVYLLLEAVTATGALFGDSYAYIDFYDYVSPNCGGSRTGILIKGNPTFTMPPLPPG